MITDENTQSAQNGTHGDHTCTYHYMADTDMYYFTMQ